MISILLDTSFLITYADPTRENHHVATRYFAEALGYGAVLYLSTIAASEFHVRQPVTQLPMRNVLMLPFNIDHAMTAAGLWKQLQRDPGDLRAVVKDDVKLLGQMVCESVTHVLTEDEGTLAKYARRLNAAGACSITPILLKDGYDSSHFHGGQTDIEDGLSGHPNAGSW